MQYDIAILFEHPDWHQPIFNELDKLSVNYKKIDLKAGTVSYNNLPEARVYYNMVSPSAYNRNNQHAIPFSFAICRMLEQKGRKVLNGTASNYLEFSKSSQVALLASINAAYPETIVFNNIEALKNAGEIHYPRILKPEQGGSGARMYLVNAIEELEDLLGSQPELWQPDNLLLLQEKLEYDHDFGIIRVEFIEGKMLYAMRVVTHDNFNLCPSVVCNPEGGGDGVCIIPNMVAKPEFYPYNDISSLELAEAVRVFNATGHHTGSIEYLIDKGGRQVFYDINANSNLRMSIGNAFGINPFEEIARYLKIQAN